MRFLISLKRRALICAVCAVVAICGASYAIANAVSKEYTFTAEDMAHLAALSNYAATDCASDYASLLNYINGTGNVTQTQALAALNRIKSYDAATRTSAAELDTLVSSKYGSVDHKYIINTNSRIFHEPDCSAIQRTKQTNKRETHLTYQELIENGYKPCGSCMPR